MAKWIDLKYPGAFSGADIYKKHLPLNEQRSKRDILDKILPAIPTYQKYRVAKRPRIKNPYFARQIRKVFQSDIIFMRNPAEIIGKNKGYQYILIIQDIFSRKLWAAPLKFKSANDVLPVLSKIINQLKPLHKNARLVIDRGTEYLNRKVSDYLNSQGIKITHPSDGHASHIERANLSLQRLLYQHMEDTATPLQWLPHLGKAMKILNNRHHRIIKMTPNQAELAENAYKVNSAMTLYRHKAHRKELTKYNTKTKPKLNINDHVRIQKDKNKFTRGYDRNYTTNIFYITEILDHLPITMYKLSDFDNNVIKGNFYSEELSKIVGDVFKVEKIIKKAVIDGVRKLFVKWEGYPTSLNSWVNAADYV